MKRLIAIGLSVLMLVGFSAHAAYEISDSNKQKYLDWIKKHGHGWSYALAVAPNGCGWYESGNSIYEAKRKALRGCKKSCKTTCEIKDVDGKSAFIKKRGSSSYSSSSSTASSSDKIWCLTKYGVIEYDRSGCIKEGHNVYSSKSQAEAEHKRLKGGSSSSYSTASSSGSKVVWCATANWATKYTEQVCKSVGGKSYSHKFQADAEHKRLKAASTPVVKTASLTIRSNVNGDSVYIDGPMTRRWTRL